MAALRVRGGMDEASQLGDEHSSTTSSDDSAYMSVCAKWEDLQQMDIEEEGEEGAMDLPWWRFDRFTGMVMPEYDEGVVLCAGGSTHCAFFLCEGYGRHFEDAPLCVACMQAAGVDVEEHFERLSHTRCEVCECYVSWEVQEHWRGVALQSGILQAGWRWDCYCRVFGCRLLAM